MTASVAAFQLSVHQNTGQLPSYSDSKLSERKITTTKKKKIFLIGISLCHKIRCTGISEQRHLQWYRFSKSNAGERGTQARWKNLAN